MIIKIYPQNPNEKSVAQAADILARDGVIIYPTDSVYAFGCSLKSTKAIERIRAITGRTGPDFSIICPDLSVVAAYAKVDNTVFKLLKRNLPGPFTFILNASGKIPDKFLEKKKTVGIRIPDNGIPIALVEALGNPMVTASVKDSREARPDDGGRLHRPGRHLDPARRHRQPRLNRQSENRYDGKIIQ